MQLVAKNMFQIYQYPKTIYSVSIVGCITWIQKQTSQQNK